MYFISTLSASAPIVLREAAYMSDTTRLFHEVVMDLAAFSMYLLELMSIILIVFTTVSAFFKLFRHERYARVYLLHGQSLGLTFKLGAEILRTITAASLMDIFEVFLLIVVKACMVVLIDRELKSADENDLSLPPAQRIKESHGSKSSRSGATYHFSLLHNENRTRSAEEMDELRNEVESLRRQLDAQNTASNSASNDPQTE